jgi:DNA-binding NarL/FixJ family response regulator
MRETWMSVSDDGQELVVHIPMRVVVQRLRAEKMVAMTPLQTTGLTPRQRDVLSLMLQGKVNKEIAEALNMSVRTVKFHCTAIFRHFGYESRRDLVRCYGFVTKDELAAHTDTIAIAEEMITEEAVVGAGV